MASPSDTVLAGSYNPYAILGGGGLDKNSAAPWADSGSLAGWFATPFAPAGDLSPSDQQTVGLINSYRTGLSDFASLADRTAQKYGGAGDFWNDSGLLSARNNLVDQFGQIQAMQSRGGYGYGDLFASPVQQELDRYSAPDYEHDDAGLGTPAALALALAGSFVLPGVGTALGSSLGIGSTFGSALAGAGFGGLTSFATGGNPLQGAVTGGLGGYFSGGGLGDLFGDTGSGVNLSASGDFGSGLDFGSDYGSGLSVGSDLGSSLGSAPLNTGLGLSGGGGTSAFGSGLDWGTGAASSPSFSDDPLKYLANKATQKATSMFSTDNLLSSGLKAGLGYALQDNNAGGYQALQNAAAQSAQGYGSYGTQVAQN